MSRLIIDPATPEQPRKPSKEPPRPAAQEPPRIPVQHVYLLISAVTATAGLAAWLYAPEKPLNHGLLAAMSAVSAVSACGYLVRSAEARVIRRIDQRLAQMAADLVAEEVRKDHEAEEYVDDMRARVAKRLQSV